MQDAITGNYGVTGARNRNGALGNRLKNHLRSYRYPWIIGLLLLSACLIHPWDGMLSSALRGEPVFQQNRIVATVLEITRYFGKGDVLLFLALILGIKQGLQKRAFSIVVALLLATILVWPLKVTVQRERPRGNSSVSFPSGDAAAVAAFSFCLAAELPLALPVAVVVIGGVALVRVIDGAHYPSDVLVGIALGVIAAALSWLLIGKLKIGIRKWHFLSGAIIFVLILFISSFAGHTDTTFLNFLHQLGPALPFIYAL